MLLERVVISSHHHARYGSRMATQQDPASPKDLTARLNDVAGNQKKESTTMAGSGYRPQVRSTYVSLRHG